ncbi:MAG: alpha/beta hydrolase [Zetaproteobacteria bacterium]|nr:MAG: alpha/beta hydrolase [Zetaproteobacteria bacterium]
MNTEKSRELVVLLHGILRSKTDMLMLKNLFQKNNYAVLNILYPSRKFELEDLRDFVHNKIIDCEDYHEDTVINFVTHSMGGLITRYYIAEYKPKNLGKVVMLGPPNTGSELADWLHETKIIAPIFKAIFGPASDQLTTHYEHIDGDITYPLGIIAGNVSVNPLSPWLLEGEHDGMVPVERTKIDGMTDHIIMPATHSFMMFNSDVMQQALHFLKYKQFNHNKGHD